MTKYVVLDEKLVPEIARKYVRYYNDCEGGVWTTEKAERRIGQIVSMRDSLCYCQVDGGNVVGFCMGYFKQYDDLVSYYLEEVVVFKEFQNKGYGTRMLNKLQTEAIRHGAKIFELMSVNDDKHMHFYGKFGFKQTETLVPLGKFWE